MCVVLEAPDMILMVQCPRCEVWCGQWEHAGWNFWCAFCGMDPTVEGPPPPEVPFGGLVGLVSDAAVLETPDLTR